MRYKIFDEYTQLDKFIGTFAGTPAEIDYKGTSGLGRIFKDTATGFSTLGAGWADLRVKLQNQDSGTGYQTIGNEYNGNGNLYFKTVKTFTKTPDAYGRDSDINCFGYAISTFGNRLEKIAQKPIQEIISMVERFIDETVKEYFVPVILSTRQMS